MSFDGFEDERIFGSSIVVVKPPVVQALMATLLALLAVVLAVIGLEWPAYGISVASSITAMLTLRVDARSRSNPNYQHGTPIVAWMRVVRWADLVVVMLSSVLLALKAAK